MSKSASHHLTIQAEVTTAAVRTQLVDVHGTGPTDVVMMEREVDALVTGSLEVKDLHKNGRADASLVFNELRIGTANFASGSVSATANDSSVAATVYLNGDGGTLDANAQMAAEWGSRLWPVRSPSRSRNRDGPRKASSSVLSSAVG